MPDSDELQDPDFDAQLRGLFQEAEQRMEDRVVTARKDEVARDAVKETEERVLRSYLTIPQMMRPMVLGIEALTRAAGENTSLIGKLDQKVESASGGITEAKEALPGLVASLHGLIDQKNGVSQRMFDALHEELKGYKDGFLLESVQKPIIRDLISLYDDLTMIHRQMRDAVADAGSIPGVAGAALLERLKTMEMNVGHNCEFIVEVLARLEVSLLPVGTGRLDKQTQRAVAVEIAEDPDEDGMIVRSTKRGFFWKGRVLRAEEVVIKKWKEGFLVALASPSSQK